MAQEQEQDPKSKLNMFVQRYAEKQITKADITYSNVKFGDQHQSTVTLVCLEGVQFAGEVAPTPKAAEKNAASAALMHFGDKVVELLSQPAKPGNKKRKASEAFGGGKGPGEGQAAAGGRSPGDPGSARSALNNLLMRVLKRPATKEECVYDVAQTASGYQCTLSLPCLPGEWAGLQWAGEPGQSQKQAQENAAQQALMHLMQDPSFAAGLMAGGGGMAWSDGSWGGGWVDGIMWGKGKGGKGKGKGKGKKPKGERKPMLQPRTRISAVPATGVVEKWFKHRGFGWIKPNEPVEHEDAAKNQGKIFLHKKDWPEGMEEPAIGAACQFQLYTDSSGLGAEEVQPM